MAAVVNERIAQILKQNPRADDPEQVWLLGEACIDRYRDVAVAPNTRAAAQRTRGAPSTSPSVVE
ncbi:MAG: hypothetical protein Q9165_007247 [Trypethelium subeluteriae]